MVTKETDMNERNLLTIQYNENIYVIHKVATSYKFTY